LPIALAGDDDTSFYPAHSDAQTARSANANLLLTCYFSFQESWVPDSLRVSANIAFCITRASVTDICVNVAETLSLCGPAFLVDATGTIMLELASQLVLILKKQHPSQLDEENEELPELHESSEYDWILVDSAMDVVLGLSKALGTQFGEIWKLVGTLLIKYASSSEAVERSTSVGVIADCIKYMEEGCTPHTPVSFTL